MLAALDLDILTTYTLPPDSYALSVVTTLTNTGDNSVAFTPQVGSFASGEDLLPWAPGGGFEGSESGVIDAALFTGRQGEATFSTWADGGLSISAIAAIAGDLGIFVADHPRVELAPGAVATLTRTLAITPDTITAESLRRSSLGEALVVAQGTVRAAGVGVAGVRVHLVDDQGAVAGFAMSGVDGAWSAELPPGQWTAYAVAGSDNQVLPLPSGAGRYGPFAAATVNQQQTDVLSGLATAPPLAFAVGRATPAPTTFELDAGGASVDLDIAAASGLHIELVDSAGAPVQLHAGAPCRPRRLHVVRGPLLAARPSLPRRRGQRRRGDLRAPGAG